MKKQQETRGRLARLLDRIVKFFKQLNCWWYGHHFEGGLVEDPTCLCGAQFEYETAICEGVKKETKVWFSRKFGKCVDCGKRFGDHSDCLPF